MGMYLAQPLSVKCANLDEVRAFLKRCRYVSDQEQFGVKDYWMPPERFESVKAGDCDDFAMWTWRQLLEMGMDARFVVGFVGRYRYSHAWVTFSESGRTFLVEPTSAWLGPKRPMLSTIWHEPWFSVGWDGQRLRYYEHEKRNYNPSLASVVSLVWEWMVYWMRTWPKVCAAWGRYFCMRLKQTIRQVSGRSFQENAESRGKK